MMSAAAGRRRKHHLQLFCDLAIGLAALALILVTSRPATADEAFRAWVEELWPEAQAFGISRKTFDTAFRNLEPDLKLPDLVLPGRKQTPRGQAEFTRPPQDYINKKQIERLAAAGRALRAEHAETLRRLNRGCAGGGNTALPLWGR
ncbi:MAG: lytic murein transglycosylase, partial [Proteobacteria bacterium]